MHASRCVLFVATARYCGMFITKHGVRFDPKNIDALQTMHEPQNGAGLVQYVAALNRMRSEECGTSSRSTGESVRG
jgi:hypothetical protein